MALPIHGGPYDGGKATALGGYVRWIDEAGVAHRRPAEGRYPYIRKSTRWYFAGHSYLRCPNCGSGVPPSGRPENAGKADHCPLCGFKLGQEPA